MRLCTILLVVFTTLYTDQLPGQELVANIAQGTFGSQVDNLQSNDDWTVFSAIDGEEGDKLFYIADPGDSPQRFPSNFNLSAPNIMSAFLLGDWVYFSARVFEPALGFRSNLYAANLRDQTMAKIISQGESNFNAESLTSAVVVDGKVALFFAVGGASIWTSDGTEAGTQYLLTSDGSGAGAVSLNGTVAVWRGFGKLMRTDGTESGTFALRDFGLGAFNLSDPVVVGDRAYLTANDGSSGFQLFSTGGTIAGTRAERDVNSALDDLRPEGLIEFDGELFFYDRSDNQSSLIYKYDEPTVTEIIALPNDEDGSFIFDIRPGARFTYFSRLGRDGLTTLWRTDGTEEGTSSIRAFFLDAESEVNPGRRYARGANGEFFFIAQSPLFGEELFVSRPSSDQAEIVSDIFIGPFGGAIDDLISFDDHLYFTAVDGRTGRELYAIDTKNADYNSYQVADFQDVEAWSRPVNFFELNGKLVFSAFSGCVGSEFYATDGTASGTVLLADANPGTGSSDGNKTITEEGAKMYYLGSGPGYKTLYQSDGTPEGTISLDFNDEQLRLSNQSGPPLTLGGKVYIPSRITNGQILVLQYDPSTETLDTILNNDSGDGLYFYSPEIQAINSTTLLINDKENVRHTIYAFDVPTSTLNQIYLGQPRAFINLDVTNNGLVYFVDNTDTGVQFFETDGTSDGTRQVSAFSENYNSLRIIGTDLSVAEIVYEGSGPQSTPGSRRLFTESGNDQALLNEAGEPLRITDLIYKDDQLIFTASTESGSTDLGGSIFSIGRGDDLAQAITSTNPNNEAGFAREFVRIEEDIYFSARDDLFGNELWKTDGTAAGTERVFDMNPGRASSFPTSLYNWNGILYFTGDDGLDAYELYRYDPENPEGQDPSNDPNSVTEVCLLVDTETPQGSETEFRVYPNPVADYLRVETKNLSDFNVILRDELGRNLMTIKGRNGLATLTVSNLQSGNYFISITNLDGQLLIHGQVIVR